MSGHAMIANLAMLGSQRLLQMANGAVLVLNEQDDVIFIALLVLI